MKILPIEFYLAQPGKISDKYVGQMGVQGTESFWFLDCTHFYFFELEDGLV